MVDVTTALKMAEWKILGSVSDSSLDVQANRGPIPRELTRFLPFTVRVLDACAASAMLLYQRHSAWPFLPSFGDHLIPLLGGEG